MRSLDKISQSAGTFDEKILKFVAHTHAHTIQWNFFYERMH